MDRISIALAAAVLLTGPALGQAPSFPPNFQTQDVTTNGTTLHVRIGGKGPAVVLLHGYGETGDMWGPLAADLARDHTVIVPDLRGMGLSAKPPSGYDKKTQGQDIAGVLDALKIEQRRYRRARHRQHGRLRVRRAVSGPRRAAGLYRRACARRRALGRDPQKPTSLAFPLRRTRHGTPRRRTRAHLPRSLLERVFGQRRQHSAKPARAHYAALYAQPGAMHAGFAQFAAFDQDAIDNKAFLAQGKLSAPVLALGGEKSFGLTMAEVMRFAAENVRGAVVPGSGHWIMEENPRATVALVRNFLDGK